MTAALMFPGCEKNPSGPGDPNAPEPDFKIAFIGDQGYGADARAVLTLIKNEDADLVLHQIWSICSWHKCMRDMQVGGKSDETGWGVYEEARKGGAIIATAHEHSYSRTHLLSSIQNKTVASRSDPLVITKGNTFVFVSGLGGESIRDQKRSGAWWASVYTSTQGAKYGALFGTFNADGNPNLATFYFKDIGGKIADRFAVQSEVERSLAAVEESSMELPPRFFRIFSTRLRSWEE